jgi:hypothetical protein
MIGRQVSGSFRAQLGTLGIGGTAVKLGKIHPFIGYSGTEENKGEAEAVDAGHGILNPVFFG